MRSRACQPDESACEGVVEEGRACNPQPCIGMLGSGLCALTHSLTHDCGGRAAGVTVGGTGNNMHLSLSLTLCLLQVKCVA